MARYDLGNEFIQLSETSGIIENISNTPVEISSQNVRRTGIILYPAQRYIFNGTIYAAREMGNNSPAAIAVENNIPKGGGGSSSGGGSVDVTPALDAINATLQTSAVGNLSALANINTTLQSINTGISSVGDLATETTHQRIAVALENLVNKSSSGGDCLLKKDDNGYYVEVDEEETGEEE